MFGEGGFAAAGGVFLEQAFFDGFVNFALSFGRGGCGRFFGEEFESAFDVLFDDFVFGALFEGGAGLFFG